jgi:predicted nucleic acid-binding protein
VILPDSNVWIYGIDTRVDEHEAAKAWFDATEEEIYLVPAIVQLEVLHYLGRNVEDEDARTPLAEGLFSFPATTEALTPATVRKAHRSLEDHREVGIGGRDAALLVHARASDATVVTHDPSLFRAALRVGLDAHDPVADA